MDIAITFITFGIWVVLFTLVGSTFSAVRRVERKIEDLVKKQEQQELYERMKNQQYNNSNYNNQL